jgi:hypothetical protein
MCTASQNSKVDDLAIMYGLLWLIPFGNLASLTVLRQVNSIECRLETIALSLSILTRSFVLTL